MFHFRKRASIRSIHPGRLLRFRAGLEALCLWLLACFASQCVGQQPGHVIVDDFDYGEQNHLGGFRNTYERAPSHADAMRVPGRNFGRPGFVMAMTGEHSDKGFCGTWIHFFDFKAPVPNYFDVTRFKYLSFLVRGEHGKESFTVKLADRRWIEKEDSVPIGRIDEILPHGLTKKWQEVVIPLEGDHGLNLKELGGIIFDFSADGRHTIFVDNIGFKTSLDDVAVPAEKPVEPPPHPASDRVTAGAMWLWTTQDMLDSRREQDRLFTFCQAQSVTELWAQLPYGLVTNGQGDRVSGAECQIQRPAALRAFLARAHEYQIKVHALDGYPEHALREWHHVSLAIVNAILDFNRDAQPNERFDGIHFDNEPHLLVGWHDRLRREQILFEFLAVNDACQQLIHARDPKLKFGVDIPFWWHDPDPKTGEALGVVTFRGKRQAASFHLIDMLDNVGIMNYRDRAQGADGMIVHGRDLLEYAEQAAGAKVYMGVETFAYAPRLVMFSVGKPRSEFELASRGTAAELAKLSRLSEHRLRVFDDGKHVHVGIELEDDDLQEKRLQVAETIASIASQLGASSVNRSTEEVQAISNTLVEALEKSPEYRDAKIKSVRDPASGKTYALVVATAHMLPKITFADDSPQQFRTQISAAETYFGRFQSFGGMAVHHYETFRDLVSPLKSVATPLGLRRHPATRRTN